ncbi:putative E3 ubiquitin-protein ligase LIN isoform X1 [Actinidia eriantha]|uniref:putative E3 ubiquitin-protein ligase LIN isoform X1 n=1 Tax=Actinidia eriantha TaxID=165200 RepID=UPI00258C5C76|nr:putative E3 ubiquitin-protein ligase LIN isoform X1 [Actinidia eriantha]XP_057510315.1 putative E3 ubiquitin-protein ligase LIN isoform X1 [Actinidia eriantha]
MTKWTWEPLNLLCTTRNGLKSVPNPLRFLPCLCLQDRVMGLHGGNHRIRSPRVPPSINLYIKLFLAPQGFRRRSMDLDNSNRAMFNTWDMEEEEKACIHEDHVKQHGCGYHRTMVQRKTSSQNYRKPKAELLPETNRPDYLRFFTCQSEPKESLVHGSLMGISDSRKRIVNTRLPPSDLSRAITTICSSESLSDCEVAIRVVTKAWLDSHGDPTVEKTLSKAPVIEGMLEVLFASKDDEVLELTISVLAEFVMRNDANRHIILNSDPQLDIFIGLLRSSSLFLKAAVLLYLVKPMAKQMISIEWVPLVLRVLEFGDHLQTLLAVQCSPQVAAYYLLDQLLTGFDEDKNLENARQVVSIGGLSLLVKRIEDGDVCEKTKAVSIIFCCIRAEGSCRHYLANNLNKGSILELLVGGKQRSSRWHAFALLTELICLNRRSQAKKFLND